MSEPTTTASASVLNVPNQLTLARIVLSLALFGFLIAGWYKVALVLFVVTAGTDWLDGYWARKYSQITQLGRVMDPFADKLFICGTFVLLSAVPRLTEGFLPSGIPAWMTVVVVGRELLVTSLRAFVEGQGGDFSAKWIGKWKMGLQCLAAIWSMVQLTYVDQAENTWQTVPPAWMTQGLTAVAWAMVALTLYSGVTYVRAAAGRFQGK
ncbi:CDP-diacylglycerol--glycerol-3-phosphate 3-phosphatidyltransferase [Bythopirellula goksoeyrii]|uniref:CDP-diacylglycerol--glycerol-3-phosphate 3-phosphatidyltransferase n=1 Tax=Bythopirellula goksoeyrii TaxID=1400387 RepID=A0A5B9Q9M9_9BACT|nr:CDP-diacylglycerol--glycerol-3-phosphate 3-phosphatidyltransferase [Bythopirellula goksoeyrii]QEG34122.1 CDP-diacylglycerol--glycerol-3-phosphate 3-phosphatidyltransferase [Bythopirellula goksoeyrii]